MTISNTSENAILSLVFQGIAWQYYADNAAGTPQTSISVALHQGDPGEGGTMATSEAAYLNYTRVSVPRNNTTGWSVSGGSCSPISNIQFPAAGVGASENEQNFSTGRTTTPYPILWYGSLSPGVAVLPAVIPILTTSTTISLD